MTKVQKSLARLGVLLVVAVVAVLSIVSGEKSKEADETKKVEESKAFTFDKAKVKSIALTAKGATTTVERDGSGWKITSPLVTKADSFAVDPIVDKLVDLRSRQVVSEDGANAAEFGLDSPRFQVVATLDDGKTVELKVGRESKFDQSIYFQRGGDKRIFQADGGVTYALDKGLFELRDKSLVAFEDADVQSIRVTTGATSWAAAREGEGWKLTEPVQDKADPAGIASVLGRLRSARATSFVTEQAPTAPADLKQYGLDKPAVIAVVALAAPARTKTVLIGEVDAGGSKKAFARLEGGGPLLELEASIVADLTKKLDDLRDGTLAGFDREKVQKLEITPAGAPKIVVLRTKEKKGTETFESEVFKLEGSADPVKSWKLSSALYTLSSLKGVELVEEHAKDLKKYGLDAPAATYAVYTDGEGPAATLLLGATKETKIYAMAAGSGRVWLVEKTTSDDLPRKREDVVEPPPAAPDAGTPAAPPAETAATPPSGG